jgi:hypothetical protein
MSPLIDHCADSNSIYRRAPHPWITVPETHHINSVAGAVPTTIMVDVSAAAVCEEIKKNYSPCDVGKGRRR